MAYTFLRVEGEWFMGFRRVDLDLSAYHGLTLIAGDRGAGRSNGASKSSILELIHWSLFGRMIRKQRKADKVMHRWAPEGARTVVRLTMDVDGRRVVIERARTRSGTTLRIHEDGVADAASTVDGVQARVEALLGKSAQEFGYTDMFSGSTAQFCQKTDAERKAVLEAMTGADRYHAASALAGEMLAATEARCAQGRERVSQLAARVEQAEVHRAAESRRAFAVIAQVRAQEKLLRERAAAASIECDRAYAALAEQHAASNQARASQREVRERLESRAARAETAERTAAAASAKADSEAAVARAGLRSAEDQLKRAQADTRPDKCPTCGQAWPDRDAGRAHVEQEVARLAKLMERMRSESAPVALAANTARTALDEARRELQSSRQGLRDLQQAVDDRRERAALSSALAARAHLEAAQGALYDHLAAQPEEGELVVDLGPATAELDRLRAEMGDAEAALRALGEDSRRLTFWKRGFGRGGLPSQLLDSSVPAMNETVGRVAAALSDGELSVSFDPAAAKGRGEAFAVNVEYRDGGDDYDMTSSGEHTRVDLAVLFALRDLVERRGGNPCTQLFLDETFAGTDAAFGEAFVGMLRTLYPGKAVFLISHDDSVKALCDRTITVRKMGREAEVVAG